MVRAAGPKTRLGAVSALIAALVAGLALAGCGTESRGDPQGEEGQGMQLGDLLYNVQISRFLNPKDDEDKAYLVGQPPPKRNQFYLGVFMQVPTTAGTPQQVPTGVPGQDTVGTEFKPVPSDSLFALDLGGRVPPNGELPKAETTAANGPIQGAMVLFLVDRAALEDRPLILDIPASTGPVGQVELDI